MYSVICRCCQGFENAIAPWTCRVPTATSLSALSAYLLFLPATPVGNATFTTSPTVSAPANVQVFDGLSATVI